MYDQSDNLIQNASTPIVTMQARSASKNLKQLCFIYNEHRECDSNSCNNGGLGRCESEESKVKIKKEWRNFYKTRNINFIFEDFSTTFFYKQSNKTTSLKLVKKITASETTS